MGQLAPYSTSDSYGGEQMVFGMSVILNRLTRLIVREHFIVIIVLLDIDHRTALLVPTA
jgi:hypothetical protein